MINTKLLKGKIVSAGMTQQELAKKMHMSENTFSSKINNKSSFDIMEVFQLCELLSINSGDEKCEIFLSAASQ